MQEPLKNRLGQLRETIDRLGPELIGNRLKRIRARQNMSVRDLARTAGMSKTSVVRMEAGESVRPTTILRACEALSIHVERLATFNDEDERPATVHRRTDDRWVDMADVTDGHVRVDRASGLSGVDVCLIQARLNEGAVMPAVIIAHERGPVRSHPGEEFVYVLSGRARMEVGTEEYVLEEGEAITFWSAEPHRYGPADPSDGPVRLLSVRIDG